MAPRACTPPTSRPQSSAQATSWSTLLAAEAGASVHWEERPFDEDALIEVALAARQLRAEGKPVSPYLLENALSGPEVKKRRVGFEAEWDVEKGVTSDQARAMQQELAADLHAQQLTQSPRIKAHGTAKELGYTEAVDGAVLELEPFPKGRSKLTEWVSPCIVGDARPYWENIQKTFDSVRRKRDVDGIGREFVVNRRCAAHVHVSTDDYGDDALPYMNLLALFHKYEDVLFRLGNEREGWVTPDSAFSVVDSVMEDDSDGPAPHRPSAAAPSFSVLGWLHDVDAEGQQPPVEHASTSNVQLVTPDPVSTSTPESAKNSTVRITGPYRDGRFFFRMPNPSPNADCRDREDFLKLQQESRFRALNFMNVRPGASSPDDRIEFRFAKSVRDPADLQTLGMLCVSLIDHALRTAKAGISLADSPKERVGSHAQAGAGAEPKDRDAFPRETASLREMLAELPLRNIDRARLAARFAVTEWDAVAET